MQLFYCTKSSYWLCVVIGLLLLYYVISYFDIGHSLDVNSGILKKWCPGDDFKNKMISLLKSAGSVITFDEELHKILNSPWIIKLFHPTTDPSIFQSKVFSEYGPPPWSSIRPSLFILIDLSDLRPVFDNVQLFADHLPLGSVVSRAGFHKIEQVCPSTVKVKSILQLTIQVSGYGEKLILKYGLIGSFFFASYSISKRAA